MSSLKKLDDVSEPPRQVDILFICVDRVWPIAGGLSARLFALIAHLRGEGWRVGLVTPRHGSPGDAMVAQRVDAHWIYRSAGVETRRILNESRFASHSALSMLKRNVSRARVGLRHALPEPFKAAVVRPLRSAFSKAPKRAASSPASFLARKISADFNRFARECAAQSGARVVVAEFAWTAPALAGLPAGVLRIVDTHDVQHLRRQRAQEAGHDLPDRDCSREEEVAALKDSDVLLAIQRGEAEVLKEMFPEKKVVVSEHALGEVPWHQGPPGSKDILYVGNLYPPNVAGAEAFLAAVWPAIRAQEPDARFVVCGKVCSAFNGRADAGLVLEGLVPSLDPFYAAAAIVVNLVPYGTGLKIKTVEALAHGKCTLVTPSGAEGLRVLPEGGLKILELDAMADAIVSLLRDPAARGREEAASWAYAQAHLSPAAVYGELTALVRDHLGQ